ncbi:hypothetical protein ACIQPR_18150 [Streptomyces sp. NPDC091280]|uniref:hypothetical protein n=1 Tax=Streptomyces sp. NPDC091280 TaxID=3365984 RepID=UPI00380E970D
MAQDSWPSPGHNSRAVTDSEYEQMASRFSDDGVDGSPAGTQVVTAGSGLTVTVRSGVRASLRGHAWYSGTSDSTLNIAANSSGSTRVDWVVLRLDRSDWTVNAAIRQGAAGSGAPALVQDLGSTGVYEIPLAQVTLVSGASSVTVTRAELYAGTRMRPCTSTTRNPTPRRGELGFETDTGRMVLWTGSSWTRVFDNSGIVSVNSTLSTWSNETESVLEARNGSVHLRMGSFTRLGNAFTGASTSRLPVLIPSDYRHPTRDQYAICYITGVAIGRITIYSAASTTPGQAFLTQHPDIHTGDSVLAGAISWAVS